jgi:hypothetical protein
MLKRPVKRYTREKLRILKAKLKKKEAPKRSLFLPRRRPLSFPPENAVGPPGLSSGADGAQVFSAFQGRFLHGFENANIANY